MDPTLITSLLEFILNIPLVGPYLPHIFAGVTTASTLAMLLPTPNKAKSPWLYLLYMVAIDLPALNFWKAKQTGELPWQKPTG